MSEALSKLGNTIVEALTPQFLALLLLNCIFIGVLFWFVSGRAEHTTQIINQLMQECLHDRKQG